MTKLTKLLDEFRKGKKIFDKLKEGIPKEIIEIEGTQYKFLKTAKNYLNVFGKTPQENYEFWSFKKYGETYVPVSRPINPSDNKKYDMDYLTRNMFNNLN